MASSAGARGTRGSAISAQDVDCIETEGNNANGGSPSSDGGVDAAEDSDDEPDRDKGSDEDSDEDSSMASLEGRKRAKPKSRRPGSRRARGGALRDPEVFSSAECAHTAATLRLLLKHALCSA